MQNTNTQTVLTVARTWSGEKAPAEEVVWIALEKDATALMVDIRGTLQGDPPPAVPAGRCDKLWEHEVAEVFIAGPDERYLELEFGPHGHYLALTFNGVRQLHSDDHELVYHVTWELPSETAPVAGNRWRGMARVPLTLLPPGPYRVNAFAMHGAADDRRYLTAYAGTGSTPDFHQLDAFEPTPL